MSTSEPVTMPYPNHPDDVLLAALAATEPDAAADQSLAAHVAGCERCTSLIADLRSLARALGELPDLRPTRPLRFLPPVPAPAPTESQPRWVGLLRRVSAPIMAVAAVLVLVGALGTATSSGPQAASIAVDKGAGAPAAEPMSSSARQEGNPTGQDQGGYGLTPGARSATPSPALIFGNLSSPGAAASDSMESSASSAPRLGTSAASGRPPFEAVLGTGIILLAAALLARAAVRRREPPGTL